MMLMMLPMLVVMCDVCVRAAGVSVGSRVKLSFVVGDNRSSEYQFLHRERLRNNGYICQLGLRLSWNSAEKWNR